jgi:ribosomal protein S3AE
MFDSCFILLFFRKGENNIFKIKKKDGYILRLLFEHHLLTRTRTKQRMKKRLKEAYENYLNWKINPSSLDQKLQSYLGILSHANQYDLSVALKNSYWIR